MSHESDPNFYSMMLGLPEELRRPNHYQLLGLEPALADRETIRDAAAERNGKLMTWQNSKYFKEAGRLMLELATVRGVLLDPEKKLAYDQELGLITVDEEPVILLEAEPEPEEEPIVLQAVEERPRAKAPAVRDSRRPRSSDIPEYLTQRPRWKQAVVPSILILFLGVWVSLVTLNAPDESEPDSPAETVASRVENSGPPRPWESEPTEPNPKPPPTPVSVNRETVDVPETPLNQPASDPAPPLAKAPFDAAKANEHQAEWAAFLNVPEVTTNSLGMKLRLIPPGEYQIGSPEDEPGREAGVAEMQRLARITKPFYCGAHEVTTEQYLNVMDVLDNLPANLQVQFDRERNLPAGNVTFYDAVNFCNELSRNEALPPYYSLDSTNESGATTFGTKTITEANVSILGGPGYRLPTEAEWEFACRAGTTTAFHVGDSLTPADANIRGNELRNDPKPIGLYPPNQFGLFDMHGSVGEWCIDVYKVNFYLIAPVEDPLAVKKVPNEDSRVVRGGSFATQSKWSRSASRREDEESDSYGFIGLRVVRNVAAAKSVPFTTRADSTDDADSPPFAVMPFDSVDARRHQTEWAKHVGLPVVEKTKDGLELKLIPPGEFQMGSPEDEPRRKPNETQHLVRIAKPFYMSTYELSFEKARAVLHNDVFNGYITTLSYYNDKQDWPFSKFNWFDAIAFCNRLSEREGLPPYYQLEFSRGKFSSRIYGAKVTVIGGTGYRLPTEAEWEWACRAGTTTATFFGDSLSATQANAGGFDRRLPYKPVGSYAPNAFGLFDMHGNIAEWCFDSYDSQFYMNSPVNDPVCEKINNFKVVRGGDYTGGYHIRSAFRGMQIDKQTGNFGLRIARTPEAK